MKNMLKSLLSVAAAVLALTSCSNDATEEVTINDEPKTLEVNATIEQTRTTLAANHINLEWSEYDEIYLYIGEEPATEPNIINPVSGGTVKATYNEDDNVYAKYSLGKSSSGVTQAQIDIAAEQTQSAANVFAGENLPMVAKGKIENGQVDLRFSPVGCVLVFNVYGPDTSEKVKSIKFETSVGCCGSQSCDLTADDLGYKASVDYKSVTVTLDDPAPIGAAKPKDTRLGENQVYMVVAQVNYPAGSKFIVTTETLKTYTFTAANGIDCSTGTARVVNLNLANAAEKQPAIEVPTVPLQSPDGGVLFIEDIVFKNFPAGAASNAEAGVYSDANLTQSLEYTWLTISSNATATLASGRLSCQVNANETGENRTAYIGIKCGVVQAAIAVTQVAYDSTPAVPDPITADLTYFVGNDYQEYSNDTWIVTCGGGNIVSLGSNGDNVDKRTLANYPAVARALGFEPSDKAAAIISKKALPAGYNAVTLEYSRVVASTQVGIAFSVDGVNWTGIMAFVELKASSVTGLKTYSFDQQGAGYYAFVAKSAAADSRIQNCKITYSQL